MSALIRAKIRRKVQVQERFIAVNSKVCKVCKQEFEPYLPLQIVCCWQCAQALAAMMRAKAERVEKAKERKADAAKRQAQKSMGKLIAEAQTAFNGWIRERDRQAGHMCISSGKPLDWTGNAVDAGHYRSRGSAPHLRFDERNCHAQSKQENRYASGNAAGYRLGLIARLGLEAVEELEADQVPRRYTRDQLIAIKTEYAAKTRKAYRDWLAWNRGAA